MLVGETPGRREDEQVRPSVGSAGKLFDEAQKHICLSRAHKKKDMDWVLMMPS
jgi:uracil-DNA glycosylase family 4